MEITNHNNNLCSVVEKIHGTLLTGNPAQEIKGFTTDTRRLSKEQMYVPLISNRDGHDFIIDAFKGGAAGCMMQVGHPLISIVEEYSKQNNKYIIKVQHTQEALYKLAHWYRIVNKCKTLGLTGSVGKTSVKDMVAAFCTNSGPTIASIANENNELGVPLTIGRVQSDTQYLIVEMGMRGLQEISLLSTVTAPDIGLITTIGSAHIGRLGSVGNIITAKLEIIDGIKENGVLIIPTGAPMPVDIAPAFERKLEELLARRTDIQIKRFAWNDDANYSLQNYQFLDFEGSEFEIKSKLHKFTIHLPLMGLAAAQNCLIASAAALELNVAPDCIVQAANELKPSKGRLFPIKLPKNIWIIDDTYNASPDAMRESVLLLGKLPSSYKKIALLGDMLELGAEAVKEHKNIGEILTRLKLDCLITVGYMSSLIANTFSTVSSNVMNYYIPKAAPEEIESLNGEELVPEEVYSRIINHLLEEVEPNTIILIKSSRAFKLDRVVNQLVEKLS